MSYLVLGVVAIFCTYDAAVVSGYTTCADLVSPDWAIWADGIIADCVTCISCFAGTEDGNQSEQCIKVIKMLVTRP